MHTGTVRHFRLLSDNHSPDGRHVLQRYDHRPGSREQYCHRLYRHSQPDHHGGNDQDRTATPASSNGAWTGSVTVTGAGTAQTISATDPVSSKAGTSRSTDVNPAAAAAFSVTGPTSATAGSAISVTVTAKDVYNNIATGYLGTIHFTSTDTHIGMALPADYTFLAGDNGSHTFTGEVTLATAGTQTVTATDTTVPAIFGISNSIAVSPPERRSSSVTAPPTRRRQERHSALLLRPGTFTTTPSRPAGAVPVHEQ